MSEIDLPVVNGLDLEVVGLTDIGRGRDHNEDCVGNLSANYAPFLESHGHLFAVADGMGGHALGEIASQLAIERLFDLYYRSNQSEPDLSLALHDAIVSTNDAVYQEGRERGVMMGTTLTVALVNGPMLIVANVGDSRVYRVRGGRVQQLTRDHSLIAEQVRRGLLTPEQAQNSRHQNVITRCVGYRPAVEVDISETPLLAGDIILLCSDGLHGLVNPLELGAYAEMEPLETAAQGLIDLANSRGGYDNISCLLVRARAVPTPPDQE